MHAAAGAHGDLVLRNFEFERDLQAVLELWGTAGGGVRLGGSDSILELQKKLARDPELFLVAARDGVLIGAVMGGFDGRRGLIYHLAVARDFRNQGVGNALMTELEARLSALGCRKAYLLVLPQAEQAISFYERRGWQKMPTWVMGKELI
jgi:ribosomal protein S18 acetylase RimI-like enzyme